MLPIVDTHQHLWDLDRFRVPWLAGVDALNRSFRPDDFAAATAGVGVVKTVYMEVDLAPEQRLAEEAYVSGLCEDDDNPMAGAVVAGRPAEPGFAEGVQRWRDNPNLKGVRQVLHGPDTARATCLQDDFVAGVCALGEAGLRYDVCLRPAELGDAVRLAERCRDTLLILDHCGNAVPQVLSGTAAPDANGPFRHTADQWRRDIDALGGCGNVVCKISGIAARAGDRNGVDDLADLLAPTVNHCLDSFGPDRVVFGGDWPVCLLGTIYRDWAAALRLIIAARPEDEQRRLLHDNALRLYEL